MERITSRANPLVTEFRKLNTYRAARRAAGLFPAEGPKLLDEALRWGAELRTVIAAEGTCLPVLPEHVRRAEVPSELLRSMADTKTPQGVLFICALASLALPQRLEGSRYLLLDGVQDPGNLGAVLRTADAFGADGVLLVNGCADPFGPKAVRATMGACFRIPVWETDAQTAAERLRAAEIPLFGAALRVDAEDVRGAQLHRAAVAVGSEGHGLSAQTLALCARTLQIPMRPRCESLNAAVAAGIILWEMWR